MKILHAVTLALILGMLTYGSTSVAELTPRAYFPIVMNGYEIPAISTKKCVGLGSGFDEAKVSNLGAWCTYFYGPNVPSSTTLSITGMINKDNLSTTGNSGYFMGWNEPDLTDPNWSMTPTRAAELWPMAVEANPGKLPVAPGISQGVGWRIPSGIDWLRQFYDEHVRLWGRPPELQALSIHCYYDTAAQCIALVQQIIDLAQEWGVPEVWVTEFAFWRSTDWEEQTRQFVSWMESEPMITRYFWWALTYKGDEPWAQGFATQLYDYTTGLLTEFGEFYRQLP